MTVAPPPMTPAEFRRRTGVSRETLTRLEAYAVLLAKWQRRINLVGRATMADPWRRHMIDSAQLAAYLPASARLLTDFGSGAGFPGLVLAITTGLEVRLIEANARKCAFLREAARATGAPARILAARIEDLRPWPTDVVTARALAPLSRLLGYAHPFLSAGDGDAICLFLKGAGVERELTEARKRWHMETERFPSASGAGTVLRLRDVRHG